MFKLADVDKSGGVSAEELGRFLTSDSSITEQDLIDICQRFDKDGNTTQRCIVCGSDKHTSKECRAPGGQQDPNKEAVWAEHRKRKEEKGKGKGGGKKGDAKGGGKKGKGPKTNVQPHASSTRACTAGREKDA